MKIIIKYQHKLFDLSGGILGDAIVKQLMNSGINCTVPYKSNNNIEFRSNNKGLMFESATENRIQLKPTDKRIESLGRDYLLTSRLTNKQLKLAYEVLTKFPTSLGLTTTILLQEIAEDPNCLVQLTPTTFKLIQRPIEKGEDL